MPTQPTSALTLSRTAALRIAQHEGCVIAIGTHSRVRCVGGRTWFLSPSGQHERVVCRHQADAEMREAQENGDELRVWAEPQPTIAEEHAAHPDRQTPFCSCDTCSEVTREARKGGDWDPVDDQAAADHEQELADAVAGMEPYPPVTEPLGLFGPGRCGAGPHVSRFAELLDAHADADNAEQETLSALVALALRHPDEYAALLAAEEAETATL